MPRKHRPGRRSQPKRNEPDIRVIFRTNLRNRRIELGLSQRALGDMLGVIQQWVQKLEAPGTEEVPSFYMLADLAAALHCLPSDLLVDGRFNAGVGADDDLRAYRGRTN